MKIRTSILLINLNTLEFTKKCVGDLLTQTLPFNLTIIDQNSNEIGTWDFYKNLTNNFLNKNYVGTINHLKIENSGYNKPINQIWNEFVLNSNTEFICLLNNDVRISPNFLETSISVMDREPLVGFVNHVTNNLNYSEWYDSLNYVVMETPYRQGWDPFFRKTNFNEIPNNLKFYYGDDYIYSKLYSSGYKGAYILNSPMIHYLSSTTPEKGGVNGGNSDKENFNNLKLPIKDLSFNENLSKWSPEFYKINKKNTNILKINDIDYDMSSPNGIEFRDKYIKSFGDEPHPQVDINWFHIDGFHLELKSPTEHEFDVQIYDNDGLIYETKLKNNMYSKLSRKYFNGIRYVISYNGNTIKDETISFENKRVLIAFDSSSLGDTISWVPYCEEFGKKHNCEVVVSTFKNFLFEESYPNIKFVKPGSVVNNIHGMFKIGWFYDNNLEPEYPAAIPLQKAITNILGLPFQEIQSNVYFKPKEKAIQDKYVCIATNSTAGCKLWNYPNGWVALAHYLINEGYKVINISQGGDKVDGVQNLKDDSMLNTMNTIYHSEFVIGLSSGLSWLSWSLGKQVVMISNFTEPDHEFTLNCIRITNPEVCNGCWNNPMFKFDKGDWYWCPEHKGTERQFECHKSITPEMVINKIQHLIN
jgi:autotransporter strand-loop-strand O-heptosyltransferase